MANDPAVGEEVRFTGTGKVVTWFSPSRLVVDFNGRWLEVSPEEIEVVSEDNALA